MSGSRYVRKVASTPVITDDFRAPLKAQYNSSLLSFTGAWAVVQARGGGVVVGRVEAVNPDHGDVVLNSAERVDIGVKADKIVVRGSEIQQIMIIGGKSKDRAFAAAQKVLADALSKKRGLGEEKAEPL